MSTTIDERVVEMRFDNKHFESNVATSMSTLEKLKQKLSLSGATKGLENLSSAAKNNNIGALGSAADTVGLRFNAMYTVADQVLRNITTRVQHTAESMVKALTLDPVKTGFKEYETQINSVQTILSNTKSKGTTIDQVNAALDELNKYADLTIYNFTEMTRNIGTFTAAGIDLDTSVSAIQGIANLAAQSGSTSQQASTAMYQLSQALATGTVKLMDWNSVVNAGMGGELFQNALKETSRLLGTGVDTAIEATGSFRESLREGWLTAEVLTETLKKFTTSGAAEYVAEYTGLTQKQIEAEVERAKATGDSSTAMERAAEAIAKMSGKSKEEIQNILEFAQDAEDAATKVKTFTQLWDVLKESAQSGWSSTWKLIIGDFEEAKNLLTPLADTLTGFINKMSDARNRVLQIALDFMSPWTAITEKLNGAGLGKIKDVINTVGDLSDKLEYYQDVVNRVWRGDYKNSDTGRYGLLDEDGYDHRIVQDLVNKGYQYKLTVEDIEASYKKFGVAVDESTEKTEQTTEAVAKLTDEQLTNAGLTEEEIRLYRALESEADRLGISMSELADDMSENNGRDMLIDSFKNIGSAISNTVKIAKGAWVDIFDPPSLEEMGIRLYGLIASLKKFTESLKLTNEAGELNDTGLKLQSTFKGIFAVLDIVTTILGGGLKIAFKVLSAVLSAFDLNILDVTANIGDALVAFRDWLFENNAFAESINGLIDKLPDLINKFKEWFAAFKETPAVQKLVDAIEAIRDAFSKLTSGEIDISEFARTLGENLAKALKSLPEIAIQIGKDFIAGFQNGIDFSVSGVIDKIVDFCLNFVEGFKEALGVQSPSWKAYETAADFFQGFINGAKAMIGSVLDVLKGIGEQIVNVFKSFWDFITDESGNVEWGKIFAGGSIVAGIWVLKQLADAFSSVAGVFDGIGDLLSGAGKTLKGFNKVLSGVAWDLKAQALQKMAIAIGILVASIWVLTTIDDPGKLRQAVAVIVILAGVLVGLSFAMEKLGSASVDLDGKSKTLNIKGIQNSIIQLGLAILLIAAAVKLIGGMDADEAKQGFIGLAGIAVGMVVFLAAMGGISRYSGDVSGIGSMMKKLAVAMILMAVACKLVGMLSAEEMLQGAAFAAGFAIFVTAITAVAKNAGEHVSKVGGMVLKLTIAMALMVGVCKLASLLSVEEMLKGAAFAAGFVIFVGALVAVTKIGNEKQLAKVSGLVLSMSLSLMMMVGVCKLVNTLSTEEMVKGGLFVAAFLILVKALVSILTIGNDQQMAKVAGTILAMSAAIAILAGVAILLSFVDTASLVKGIAAVGMLSLIMSLMVKSLKGAQNAKGAIMMMAIAIGVMAAAVVALSFIPVEDLLPAAGAMTIMMGAFALMVKSLKGIKGVKVGPLIVLTGVVLVLAGIVALLSLLDPKSVLPNAAGLSLLLIAMSSAMLILSKTKGDYTTTLAQLESMVLVIAELAIILGLMSFLPNPTNMIPSAIAIGILLNTLATSMLIMSKAKGNFKMTCGQLQSMALVIAEVAIILGLMSFLPNPTNMIPSAIAIGILLNTLATSILIMSKAKGNFSVSFTQLQSMVLVMAEIAVILSLMSFLPNPTNMIPSAIAIGILLNALAAALVIASLAGSRAASAASAMVVMGIVLAEVAIVLGLLSAFDIEPSIESALALSTLLLAMSAACLIVSLIPAGAGIAGAIQLAAFIGIMAAVITAAGLLSQIPGFNELLADGGNTLGLIGEAIGKFVGGIVAGIAGAMISIIPQLGIALSVFAVGVQPFISLVSRIDSSVIEGAGYLTAAILALTAASFISGISSILSLGQSSLVNLGLELSIFGRYAKIFFDTIKDVDENAVNAATNVGNMILALTASELISTITEKFGGSANFSTMGENLKTFGEAVVGFSDTISGKIDTAAVEAATNAGLLLVELNKSLPRSGGWIQDIIGEQDFGKFAESCKAFATAILDINEVVSQEGFEIQEEKLKQLVAAGTAFSELNKSLPRTDGWLQDIIGEQDLSAFGESVKAFAECIISLNETLSDEGLVIQEDKLAQLATAGTKFSELNNALPKSDGWLQDVIGEKDLSNFGDSVKHFADCLIKVNEALSQEGFAVNLDGMEQLKQAGLKMNDLQSALPKSGGWWESIAGSEDLGDFGESIKTFAEAMVDFSTSGAELSTGGVDLALTAAKRIKAFITSLENMDYSGVEAFTGVGTGGVGADGPAYDIACAIAKFGDKVADIDTEAVTVAVRAARNLKTLIAGLVGLDTSGIENFKPGTIGDQMKAYSDKVAGIDTGTVSNSISAANRLKNFIAGLVDLDTSGVSKFNPGKIGAALTTYSTKIAGLDIGTVSSSITAANRLKNFISSLAGLDSSGVSGFKAAVESLAEINLAGIQEAFDSAATQLAKAGSNIMDSIVKGMESKTPTVIAACTSLVSNMQKIVISKVVMFNAAGLMMMVYLSKGIAAGRPTVISATISSLSAAASATRVYYYSFYSAGSYLVTGFANGISANSYKAVAKARAMAKAAAQAAKNALDINSPSKVFKKIGASVPEGFAMGIDELAGMVKKSSINMANTALDGTKAAMLHVSEMMSTDADYQPTITPVLDLSNVESGAGSIASMFNSSPSIGVTRNVRAVSALMNENSQNGTSEEIVSAINRLRKDLGNVGNTTYSINGVTYDDGSNIQDAISAVVRQARIGRRV